MKNFETFPWRALEDWFVQNGRHDFPWREYEHISKPSLSYRVWLAEILLQQTQAERVIPFFERILARFPSISELSKTDYETFFPFYK